MSTVEFDLLCAFEVHSVNDIRAILDAGFDVRQPIKGKSIVNSLIEMYSRSDQFPDCLRLLLDRGAALDDPRIAPVLLDDAKALTAALDTDASLISHRASLVSAFTPLIGASLLMADVARHRRPRLLFRGHRQRDVLPHPRRRRSAHPGVGDLPGDVSCCEGSAAAAVSSGRRRLVEDAQGRRALRGPISIRISGLPVRCRFPVTSREKRASRCTRFSR